jgi:RNA polymerase sigma-70 factor (ECF subfamily)
MISEGIMMTPNAAVFSAAWGHPNSPSAAEVVLNHFDFSEDESLARQIQSGRMDLMELLIRRHSDRLFRVILHMVPAHNAAEDILQDTWVRVIRKIHQYNTSFPLLTWLTSIALNQCRDYWRRERLRNFWKRSDTAEGTDGTETIPAPDSNPGIESRMDVSRALAKLPQKFREVVVLKFYSGLTQEEIARVLKVPDGTVKSRLYYALGKLRRCLENKEAFG